MGTEVPQGSYVDGGRSAQKRRTRDALLAAARAELAAGRPLTVESAAAAAGISRTTAYRYFANHRDLITAAHPQIDVATLLPDPAPSDPVERLALTMRAFLEDVTLPWEPQLRAALRLSLAPTRSSDAADAGTLRRGRGIGWIVEALRPLEVSHPHLDLPLLARAIRSASGIESLIWLTDVGGLSRSAAAEVMHASAVAILRDAMSRDTWPS